MKLVQSSNHYVPMLPLPGMERAGIIMGEGTSSHNVVPPPPPSSAPNSQNPPIIVLSDSSDSEDEQRPTPIQTTANHNQRAPPNTDHTASSLFPHSHRSDMRIGLVQDQLEVVAAANDDETSEDDDDEILLSDQDILTHIGREIFHVPEIDTCAICQEEYVNRDELGILDCGHKFHLSCIQQWLRLKNQCPICKRMALCIHG